MRNYFLILLTLCFSTFTYAHKDKLKLQTHGNIKTFCTATFHYSVFEKVTAIGILSEKLAKELNYKDTLLIEVRKPHFKKASNDYYRFDVNNSAYHLICEPCYEAPYKAEGMSIRIQAKDINVTDVLKIVEYAILNKKKLDKLQKIQKDYNEKNEFLGQYRYIPKEELAGIWKNQSSLITGLISEKIPLLPLEENEFKLFWQNNNFIFEYKRLGKGDDNIVLSIPNYYYFTSKNWNGLVFLNPNQFYYINSYKNEYVETQLSVRLPVFIEADVDRKLIFYDFMGKLYMLLINKKKVISDFESCL